MFNPKLFVEEALEYLKKTYGSIDCAIACVSGGVDSVTAAIIAEMALRNKVVPVFIDTGLMRFREAEAVRESLRDLMDLRIYDYSNYIVSELIELSDAEEKRRIFRDLFYSAVSDVARRSGCSYVVQGTTRADVDETLGGVKTQHNVLTQELMFKYGVKAVEPLKNLYKNQVRAVAHYLSVPPSIINRQPFPGPGLLIRAVGKFSRDKLELVRHATKVVDEELSGCGYSQYFPAVWEYDVVSEGFLGGKPFKVFSVKTTGFVDGSRVYGRPVLVGGFDERELLRLYEEFNAVRHPHVLIPLASRSEGKYFTAIRIVETEDYLTARVPLVKQRVLLKLAEEILEIPGVRAVGYDVTPKPPATIEYE